jgi:anti-anti-sigma factor
MGKNKDKMKLKEELKLSGTLSIYEAAALRDKLRAVFKDMDVLEINMTEVAQCDTTCLQLLCSAKKTAERDNKKIVISMISDEVREAMTKTGISFEMLSNTGGEGCQK